jgi:hypothetical protein
MQKRTNVPKTKLCENNRSGMGGCDNTLFGPAISAETPSL